MAKEKSFAELKNQFDDAMATMTSIYELMLKAEARSDYNYETLRRIGRGGISSTKKAEVAFNHLTNLYFDEQQKTKYYAAKQKRSSNDSMIERAVTLIDIAKAKHAKQ